MLNVNLTEVTTARNTIYKGRIINLRKDDILLPNGKEGTRELVEHPGGVCVLALDEEENLYLVEQFRYPYGTVLLEIPAGKRDPGEEPLSTAKRELAEETGLQAEKYEDLGQMYPTPGYSNEVIYIYLATGLYQGESRPDEDEFLQMKKIPLAKAVEMVMDNTIKDAKTQIAVLKVWQKKRGEKNG